MPRAWEWDATLFAGAASHYDRGRLPYPAALAARFRSAADLHGAPRLLDVGCGPGPVALTLADLFDEVVGIDPDPDMLGEAANRAARTGVRNARWVKARAEEIPGDLGRFRYATFAQSFHWMERQKVAAVIFEMLEPGGAFVHVNTVVANEPPQPPLPFPLPPRDGIDRLVKSYLGAEQRAGRGILRYGTPGGEAAVLAEAGFQPARHVVVEGRQVLRRSVDDIVANTFSKSGSVPHLFGEKLSDFERDLRRLLEEASDHGQFSEWLGDIQLDFYLRPSD